MKQRRVIVIIILMLLIFEAGCLYIYRDRIFTAKSNTFIEVGKNIIVNDMTDKNQGMLVPEDFIYEDPQKYTKQYTVKYEVIYTGNLVVYNLGIDMNHIYVGETAYGSETDIRESIHIVMESSEGIFEQTQERYGHITEHNNNLLVVNIKKENSLYITISFTVKSIRSKEMYDLIIGKRITFDMRFILQ